MLLLAPNAYALSADDVFDAIAANQFSRAKQLAAQSGNPLLVRYASWAAITDEHADVVRFSEAYTLLQRAADWPLMNRVQLKAEQAALLESPTPDVMNEFCTKFPPISGRGMLACASAGVGTDAHRRAWVQQGWKQGDFTREEEDKILARYGAQLTLSDHRARMERLLYEGKTTVAQKMLWRLPKSDHALMEARIALRNNASDANSKLSRVPPAQQSDAGLVFERMRWRNARGMDAGVMELFLSAPRNPAYADLWWPLRAVAARTAMRRGQAREALRVLQYPGDLKREFMAEALWMRGWIYYAFLNDSRSAYEEFYALHKQVQYPVSKARAAYWAGMAAKRNGNTDIAQEWLERAAEYPTVFYGQLAHGQLQPDEPLSLPSSPSFSRDEKENFDREDVIRMVMLLARHGQENAVDKFILHLAETTDKPARFALLANLARAVGQAYDAVRVAKLAIRHNVVLLETGWPTLTLPANLAIEPALTLAITRQESEFNSQAQSHANARGLMQLLPATAQQTARKIGEPYGLSRLWEQAFNLRVGSAFLGRLIDAYGGSYISAIAGYNAGPGNVRKWLGEFGSPSGSPEQALRFMESIPFAETRNYVQRVLENLQIYRARLKQQRTPVLVHDLNR